MSSNSSNSDTDSKRRKVSRSFSNQNPIGNELVKQLTSQVERLTSQVDQLEQEKEQEKREKERIAIMHKEFLSQLTDVTCGLEGKSHLKVDQIQKINQLSNSYEGLSKFKNDQLINRICKVFQAKKKQ